MMNVKNIHTVLLAMTLVGCNAKSPSAQGLSASELAAQREVLMALERQWSEMYGRGDVQGITALLTEDSLLLAPGKDPAVGRDKVVVMTRELMAAEAADGMSVAWKPVDATVSSCGDMAWDYGQAKTRLADGTLVEGAYLVVWTRQDGQWKVAADIFN